MAFGSGKNFIFQLASQLLERQKSINLAVYSSTELTASEREEKRWREGEK